MLNSMLFAAVMLVLAFYLQDGLHYSPLHASIVLSKTLYGLNEQMIGTASGVYSTLQEVANALGVTIIGVIFAAVLAHGGYTNAFGISLLVISLTSVGQFLLVFLFPKQD